MPRPLQGADDWAPAARSEPGGSRRPDTIERVIERRVPTEPRPDVSPMAPPRPVQASLAPPVTSSLPSSPLTPGTPTYLFVANRTLSGSALKVLLAVLEAGDGAALLRNDFKRLTGLSGDHAILNAVQECVDNEWLLRRYQCRWCLAPLVSSYDTIRLTECAACGRKMTPQAVFCLGSPEGVPNEHGGMSNEHTGVSFEHTRMSNEHTEDVSLQHTPVLIKHGGMSNEHTQTPMSKTEGGVSLKHMGMPNEHTLSRRDERQTGGNALAAKVEGMLKKHTGMSNEHTQGMSNEHTRVPNEHTSPARADSDSRIIESKNLDSRIPPSSGSSEAGRVVYASAEWQQMTEKLAKDTAKRIGDKSVGFHIKVWAHARKVDWEKGGRWFEEGLLAIAQELEGKHKATGKSQGALWTKMVRRYSEEKGSPLLTEAEAEEWKELHGSYTPPRL